MELPLRLKELLDSPTFATLVTVMPDGSPQATTMWVDRDGDHIRFNTAEGRVKPDNISRDPRVAIALFNPEDPYEAYAIRGRTIEMTTTGAEDHIDALAQKYLGTDYSGRNPGMVRLVVTIEVEQVAVH